MSSHFNAANRVTSRLTLWQRLRRVNDTSSWPEEQRRQYVQRARFRVLLLVGLLGVVSYQYPETSFVMSYVRGVGMFDPAVQRGEREFKWWDMQSLMTPTRELKLRQDVADTVPRPGDEPPSPAKRR